MPMNSDNLNRMLVQQCGNDPDWDYREVFSTPVPSRARAKTRLTFKYLRGDQLGVDSITGLMSEITEQPYYRLSPSERMKARKDECHRLLVVGVRTGLAVEISFGSEIEESNVNMVRRSSNFVAKLDYRTERSLIASLMQASLLLLWERQDSRLLRGTKTTRLQFRASCQSCIFARSAKDGDYCGATFQDRRGDDPYCQDYARAMPVVVDDDWELYERLEAQDVWRPRWLDDAVWNADQAADNADGSGDSVDLAVQTYYK